MKTSILFGIMSTIIAEDKVSADFLAKKYEISTRSVYRYIEMLCEAQVPIIAQQGRNGGFYIMDNFKINATFFTPEEYNRLIPAIASYYIQDNVTNAISDKLKTLSAATQHASFVLKSDQLAVDTPIPEQIQSVLSLLTKAVSQRLMTEIEYHDRMGSITKRTIKPLSLVLKDGVWYVYSYCTMRCDFRFFKISRIAEIALSGKGFEKIDFDLEEAKKLFMPSTAETVSFTFTFNASILSQVEEWLGIGAVSPHENGYTARAKLPFDNMLISKLLSFGNAVQITDNDTLKEAVKSALISALDNYK